MKNELEWREVRVAWGDEWWGEWVCEWWMMRFEWVIMLSFHVDWQGRLGVRCLQLLLSVKPHCSLIHAHLMRLYLITRPSWLAVWRMTMKKLLSYKFRSATSIDGWIQAFSWVKFLLRTFQKFFVFHYDHFTCQARHAEKGCIFVTIEIEGNDLYCCAFVRSLCITSRVNMVVLFLVPNLWVSATML
jgi:hypothetical protein